MIACTNTTAPWAKSCILRLDYSHRAPEDHISCTYTAIDLGHPSSPSNSTPHTFSALLVLPTNLSYKRAVDSPRIYRQFINRREHAFSDKATYAFRQTHMCLQLRQQSCAHCFAPASNLALRIT
jgi:hypothetical protein